MLRPSRRWDQIISRAASGSHLQTGTLLEELCVVAADVFLPKEAEASKSLEVPLQGRLVAFQHA